MLQRDANHATDELGREEAEQRQPEIDQIDLQQQRCVAHQLDVGADGSLHQPVLGHIRSGMSRSTPSTRASAIEASASA